MTTHRAIQISKISKDKDLQLRAEMSEEKILDYMEAYRRGDNIPPIVLFREEQPELGAAGPVFWLADGWHRAEAEERLGSLVVNAIIKEGDKKAAKFYALTANATNGLDLSQADRRKIITTLFVEFEEWRERGDREIARQLKLRHHDLVSTIRKELEEAGTIPEAKSRKVTRGGKTFTQKASKESAPASGGNRQIETPLTGLHSRDKAEIDRDTQGVFNQPAQTSANGTRKPEQTPLMHCDSKDCMNPPRPPSRYCEPCLRKFGAIPAPPEKSEGAEDSAPSQKNGGGYQHYCTPEWLLNLAREVDPITLDPCSNQWSKVKATFSINEHMDGLSSQYNWNSFTQDGQAWINPPYKNLVPWAERTVHTAKTAVPNGYRPFRGILPLPCKPSRKWWQILAKACDMRCDLFERVCFEREGVPDDNPVDDTTLFYFGDNWLKFARVFEKYGLISQVYEPPAEEPGEEKPDPRQQGLPGTEAPQETTSQSSSSEEEKLEDSIQSDTLKPAPEGGEPSPWLALRIKDLNEALFVEDYDALYDAFISEASDNEIGGLEKHREDNRSTKPHRGNVAPAQVLAARAEAQPTMREVYQRSFEKMPKERQEEILASQKSRKRAGKDVTCVFCGDKIPLIFARLMQREFLCGDCIKIKPPSLTFALTLRTKEDVIIPRFNIEIDSEEALADGLTLAEADGLCMDPRLIVSKREEEVPGHPLYHYEQLPYWLEQIRSQETEALLSTVNKHANAWLPLSDEKSWKKFSEALNKRLAEIKAPISSPLKQKKTAPSPTRKQEAAKPTKKPAKKGKGKR